MKIRAILMDMDGTVLGNSQVAISVRNMEAIQKAIDNGVHVIPCTGRIYDMLPPQLLTLKGIRYVVSSHGARAYDCIEKKSLYEDLISPEQASELMEILEGKGLYNEIAAEETIFFEKKVIDNVDMAVVPEHHVWYVRDNCYTAIEKPSKYFLENKICLEKMNLYGIPKELQQEIFDKVTATGYIQHTRGAAGPNLEFQHAGMKKLNAVDAILEKLGVTYEETFAIGDSSSDLEIIKACGIGVAMGNAPDDIKQHADYVTGLNTEDGFAQAVEKFVL